MSDQARKNHEAYNAVRAEMEDRHFGKAALMHDGEIVGIYNDSGDAYSIGCEKFGLGHFSIELVGERPVHLGVFTLDVLPSNTVFSGSYILSN